jgi:hypothetical protein
MPSAVLTHRMPGTADRTDGHPPHSCYDRRSLAPHACRTCVTIGGPERRTTAGLYCQVKSGTMQVPGENTCNMILLPVKIAGILPALPGICVRYGRHSGPAISLELPAAAPSLWSAVRNISDGGWLIENVDATDHRNALVRDEYNLMLLQLVPTRTDSDDFGRT